MSPFFQNSTDHSNNKTRRSCNCLYILYICAILLWYFLVSVLKCILEVIMVKLIYISFYNQLYNINIYVDTFKVYSVFITKTKVQLPIWILPFLAQENLDFSHRLCNSRKLNGLIPLPITLYTCVYGVCALRSFF